MQLLLLLCLQVRRLSRRKPVSLEANHFSDEEVNATAVESVGCRV